MTAARPAAPFGPLAAAALLLVPPGCGGADPAAGRAALGDLLGPLPADAEVLAWEPAADPGGAAGWVIVSPDPLPAPAGAVSGPAPAGAALSAAAAMAADPARVGEPAGGPGAIREWTAAGVTVRVRSIRTDQGLLSHVETLPE